MTWLSSFEISSSWLLVPILLAVIAFDLRLMKIPNVLVALLLIVFVATVPASIPFEELVWRFVSALCVLAASILAFAARLMGGGDGKILAALTLLIPTSLLAHFALFLSVGLIIGLVLLAVARGVFANSPTHWKSLNDRKRYPMGLSIGLAGIAFLYLGPHFAYLA